MTYGDKANIGKRVRFLQDITEGPTGDSPGSDWAREGDEGGITELGFGYSYVIKMPGRRFGADAHEFEIISEKE